MSDLFNEKGPADSSRPKTNTEKLNELKALVIIMRNYQKAFFKSAPGTRERNEVLINSKQAEAAVDKFLKQI